MVGYGFREKCWSLEFTWLTVPTEDRRSEKLETIHARYLVACDGAHSWTRRQLQVPTEARSESSTWGVIDIVPITDFRMHRFSSISPSVNNFPQLIFASPVRSSQRIMGIS